MFYNMRNPPGCFRLPVKACRPQSQIGSIDRFTTVQGFAANHEQGRVNPVKLSKEQRAVFHSRFLVIKSSRNGIFTRNIFQHIYGGALDKRKKRFSEKRGAAPAKNLRSFTRQTSRRSNIQSPATRRMAACRRTRGQPAAMPARRTMSLRPDFAEQQKNQSTRDKITSQDTSTGCGSGPAARLHFRSKRSVAVSV